MVGKYWVKKKLLGIPEYLLTLISIKINLFIDIITDVR